MLRAGALQVGALRVGALQDWCRGFQWFPGNSREFPDIHWISRKSPGIPVISRGLMNVGALRLRNGESGAAGWCAAAAGR